MRAKAMKLNAATSILYVVVTIAFGLVLPRVILSIYGSASNGLVSSISQFLAFSVVLRAGVGAVTRAALFKPLAEKNNDEISAIMVSTNSYMKKIALILAGGIFAFAFVYPFMVVEEYNWFYSFLMVLVLGMSTFAENFFGIKNMILIQADQKYYIQNLSMVLSYVLSAVVSLILMRFKLDILFVKFGATIAYMIRPLFLEIYVRRTYKLDMSVKANNYAIKQRWDAFVQQIAVIVNGNIDIVLITLFSPLSSVSVYTVHFMVVNNIGKLVQAPVTGLASAFGNMFARKEYENLKKAFSFMEWAMFALGTFAFSVTAVMITPFIDLYTSSITDVNYHQPLFGLTMVMVTLFNCLRLPYQLLVEAVGHFKQTRNGAILEVVLNICVSIVALIKFGLIGVLIGTFVSCIVRTIQYSWYATKKVLNGSFLKVAKNYIVYICTFVVCMLLNRFLPLTAMDNYFRWFVMAMLVSLVSLVIIVCVSIMFNTKDVLYLYKRMKNKFTYRKRSSV